MSNASSLFPAGLHLTNLIVLTVSTSRCDVPLRMWPAALAAVGSTRLRFSIVVFGRGSSRRAHVAVEHAAPSGSGIGLALAVAVAAVLVLVLASPALPVLVVGVAAVAVARTARALVLAAVDVRVLAALFALAVALGTLGRS